MVRSARRSPRPPSWLTAIESATAAFTGTARVTGDAPAPTTSRGNGFAVTAEIQPDRVIFGHLADETGNRPADEAGSLPADVASGPSASGPQSIPAGPVTVRGETSRPPERRLDPAGPRFPPDSLREVPYWDQARTGSATPVLVVLTEPPVVRSLLGTGDDLPSAVAAVRGWVERGDDVESSLPGASAVGWVAGFELLLRTATDVPALTARILGSPGIPGAAVRGILALLATADPAPLARTVLDTMAGARDPEAVVAALTWLDANRGQLAGLDQEIRAAAERATRQTFEGDWQQEVARHAEAITGGR